jgi:hypothetical protein
VVGSSRSCSRPAVPTSVRTWRTVRLVGTDSPRGASQPGVLLVRRVFLSAFILIHLVVCFGCTRFGGQSARRGRTVREERPDSPSSADGPRVEGGRSVIEGAVWWFGSCFRTVRRSPRIVRQGHTDGPLGACGRSAWC